MVVIADLQKQLSSLLAQAHAQELKPHDFLPREVQAHFDNTEDLATARDYIKEVDGQKHVLTERNEALQKELKDAKQAVEDLLADHQARLVDLKQAEYHVKFYKDLMDAAEDRASKYQQKWQEALAEQIAADEAENKIFRLKSELADSQTTITKLIEENRGMTKIFDTVREKDLRTLENNEMKLLEMTKTIRDTNERYKKLEDESERFEQTYTTIVEQMDSETVNCADAINKTALKLEKAQSAIHRNNRLRMATVSEIQPLRRFYDRCFNALLIHQTVLVQLFGIHRDEVVYSPDTLEANLKSATSELETFRVMRDTVELEGIECDEVRHQLNVLAVSANRMHETLGAIAGEVKRFLTALDESPSRLAVMRYKYVRLLRG